MAGLSLQVPAGTKYGLLGANGAGKTTFVKMLLAAVRPTTGRALLFGREANEPESRRHVGYLPENHRFPTYFTGSGMLDFYGALSGMNAADRARRQSVVAKLDEHRTVAQSDGIGFEGSHAWGAEHRSRTDVEFPVMPGALDDVTVERALLA